MVAGCLFYRERERGEAQRAARNLQSAPTLTTKQKQQHVTDKLHKDQKLQTKVHMSNLKVGSYVLVGEFVYSKCKSVEDDSCTFVCAHVSVFAEAFLWMVFSGVGQKDTFGQGHGPLWLEDEVESMACVASCGVGCTKAARGCESRGGATGWTQARAKANTCLRILLSCLFPQITQCKIWARFQIRLLISRIFIGH